MLWICFIIILALLQQLSSLSIIVVVDGVVVVAAAAAVQGSTNMDNTDTSSSSTSSPTPSVPQQQQPSPLSNIFQNNDGECVVHESMNNFYPYYFNVSHQMIYDVMDDDENGNDTTTSTTMYHHHHSRPKRLMMITITPFLSAVLEIHNPTDSDETTNTTIHPSSTLLVTPSQNLTAATRYIIQQQQQQLPLMSHNNNITTNNHNNNNTVLDELWDKQQIINITTPKNPFLKWISFFLLMKYNHHPSSMSSYYETIHNIIRIPSTLLHEKELLHDNHKQKKHRPWYRKRQQQQHAATNKNNRISQRQYHRWYSFDITTTKTTWWSYLSSLLLLSSSSMRSEQYRTQYYTWHSIYIPEQNMIYYNVTRTTDTTGSTTKNESVTLEHECDETGSNHNHHDREVVVLYGSTYHYSNPTNDNDNNNSSNTTPNLSSTTMTYNIHTIDIVWDELLPSTWILSRRIFRPFIQYIIQYWLQQYMVVVVPSNMTPALQTITSTSQVLVDPKSPMTILIPISTMINHSVSSSTRIMNQTNEEHWSDTNSTIATSNTQLQQPEQRKNVLQSAQSWFNDQTTRLIGNINNKVIPVPHNNDHLDRSFGDTNIPPSLGHSREDVTIRPIGLTRYVLVCSILLLSLYNIHLYFSQ